MIEIIVNCNDDTIGAEMDGKSLGEMKVDHPSGLCRLLYNIFDKQDDFLTTAGWGQSTGIRLTKIDEDRSTTVGEW